MSDREKFEKWWCKKYSAYRLAPKQTLGGEILPSYIDLKADLAWQAWQAARESEGGEAVQYVRECQYGNAFPCNPCCEDFGYCSTKRVATPQPDKWIPCSERLPTMNDADHYGQVIGWDFDNRESVIGPPCDFKSADWLTHWMPTGLTENSPPERESE